MTRATIAAFIALPVLFMAGVQSAAAHLDRATREQCANHKWPPELNAAHLEFCRTYLGTTRY